jgi:hypothetical protein
MALSYAASNCHPAHAAVGGNKGYMQAVSISRDGMERQFWPFSRMTGSLSAVLWILGTITISGLAILLYTHLTSKPKG